VQHPSQVNSGRRDRPFSVEVSQMSTTPFQSVSALMAVAQGARQLRDVQTLVETTCDVVKKFWFVAPLLAAGWVYMVSDEERLAVLEGIADQVLGALPIPQPGS
jgi:hypothetical protein